MTLEQKIDDSYDDGMLAGRTEGKAEGLQEGIAGTAAVLRSLGMSEETIVKNIVRQYHLTKEEAEAYL